MNDYSSLGKLCGACGHRWIGGTFQCPHCRHDTALERFEEKDKRIAALEAQNAQLLAALKNIEAHHVEINERAGRNEARSETLRIVRAAIKNAKGGE